MRARFLSSPADPARPRAEIRFPAATFVVCVTAFAIVTESLVFDYLKYSASVRLLRGQSQSSGVFLAPTQLPPGIGDHL